MLSLKSLQRIALTVNGRIALMQRAFAGISTTKRRDVALSVIGCGIGFGEAVKWEQSWASILGDRIAVSLSCRRAICLNFSQSGALNDYIARTAIRQCQAAKRSLLVAYFTNFARKEIIEGEEFHAWGAWNADSSEFFCAQLGCYTNEEMIVNTLKNMLLLQYFCGERNIPYFFLLQVREKLICDKLAERCAFKDLFNLIDWRCVADYRMQWIDHGRDNRHPGPCSHRSVADNVFTSVNSLISR